MRSPKTQSIYSIQHLPPGKMLITLAWPVVVSMMVQGVYGLVDSLYLAVLGETVMSAMSLAFVGQNLANFFFSGIATGLNAVISRALGEGDREKAKGAVISGCVVQLCMTLVVMFAGIFIVQRYFVHSSTVEEVQAAGTVYLKICLILSLATASQVTFERLLQASGLTRHMLRCQLLGFAVNMVLDPLLIFAFRMGCAGAAVATVLGQTAAGALALYYNIKHNGVLFHGLLAVKEPGELWLIRGYKAIMKRFRLRLAGRVVYIGIPSAAVGIASCICTYCINRILIGFSPTSNAAFGIYAKVESFATIPGQGISAAMVTLLAFFYGSGDFPKMRSVLKAGTVMAASWFWLCGTLFILFPREILACFKATEQMYGVGIPAFRIVGSTFYLSGFMISLGAFYQAIGKSVYSLVIALSRQILVRIPAAYLLALLCSQGDQSLIWWCWPISEVVSDTVSVLFFVLSYKRVRQELTGESGKGVSKLRTGR